MKYLVMLLFFTNTILAQNQIIEALKTRVVQVDSGNSVCTGVIVNSHEILTAAHCFVEEAYVNQEKISLKHLRTYGTITTLTGLTQTVVVAKVGKDTVYNDLALLDAGIIQDGNYSTLPLSTLSLNEGGWVIGCQFKGGRDWDGKCNYHVYEGLLTGYDYYNYDRNYMNIDPNQFFFLKLNMPIISGDSGSPVFDQYGNLSGIIVRRFHYKSMLTEEIDGLALNIQSILRFYNNP